MIKFIVLITFLALHFLVLTANSNFYSCKICGGEEEIENDKNCSGENSSHNNVLFPLKKFAKFFDRDHGEDLHRLLLSFCFPCCTKAQPYCLEEDELQYGYSFCLAHYNTGVKEYYLPTIERLAGEISEKEGISEKEKIEFAEAYEEFKQFNDGFGLRIERKEEL